MNFVWLHAFLTQMVSTAVAAGLWWLMFQNDSWYLAAPLLGFTVIRPVARRMVHRYRTAEIQHLNALLLQETGEGDQR